MLSFWIAGTTRSGKSDRLVEKFRQWVRAPAGSRLAARNRPSADGSASLPPAILVLAANDDNRRTLTDRLAAATEGSYPAISKTPLGFISDEVMLFWPLLFELLKVKAQFPLRLRPETEQELATRLWRATLDGEDILTTEINEYRFVRQTLDLLQLAGAACIPAEEIPQMLELGLMAQEWDAALTANPTAVGGDAAVGQLRGQLLLEWRQWCLERGLLSYGIIYELYWRYLLPNPTYQYHLIRRYQAVFADDVDDYPAIARDLIETLLDRGAMGVFTFNPDGKIRLGLNADPNYLEGLAERCQVEELGEGEEGEAGEQRSRGENQVGTKHWVLGVENLASNANIPNALSVHPIQNPSPPTPPWERGDSKIQNRPESLAETAIQMVNDPGSFSSLPLTIRSIQTTSRAALLRQTAEVIIESVKRGEVQPNEIAIIAPGLDAIARYTLIEILSARGILIEPLNEQRPLISSPPVRALLTLLALVYPGLGRSIDRDAVAEMLVVLSGQPQDTPREEGQQDGAIDPVRAGLIADYCYQFDPEQPRLLPVETFPRWDRLGHRATQAYQNICNWIEQTKLLLQQQSPSVLAILDRAIKDFLWNGVQLSFDRLSALRELMESAQHFWEVERRLRQNEPTTRSPADAIAQFIQLLRRGTITANAYPVRPLGLPQQNAITLATIFQYRSSRRSHRWHFWLDASSQLWQLGGAATLFAAPLFLKEWSGFPWMPEDQVEADRERLERILRDLLARAEERIYLCHSDLAANGTEQTGPLLPLVYAATPLTSQEETSDSEFLIQEGIRD